MIQSFPAHLSSDVELLILGSIPGKKSLELEQYYGHPQNLFWNFIEEIFVIQKDQPYEKRMSQLLNKGVGLWDVVRSCDRDGSLDSAIRNPKINDFYELNRSCPNIKAVLFNGKKSEQLFRKHIELEDFQHWELISLPSTSPANASIPKKKKLRLWQSAISQFC